MELDIQQKKAIRKFAKGIRGFTVDQIKLEKMLAEKL